MYMIKKKDSDFFLHFHTAHHPDHYKEYTAPMKSSEILIEIDDYNPEKYDDDKHFLEKVV